MNKEVWLTNSPDGVIGCTDDTGQQIAAVEYGCFSYCTTDEAYNFKLTREQSAELAVRILAQQGLVLVAQDFTVAGKAPWQRFLLGASFDAGVSVVNGRAEIYPADGAGSVWGTRQWSRELAIELLRQQVELSGDRGGIVAVMRLALNVLTSGLEAVRDCVSSKALTDCAASVAERKVCSVHE